MSVLLFKMWEPFRETLIAEHCFYVEQARKRLLSQFENIEAEADSAAAEHLDRMSNHFDPDRHDPSDFHEAAYEKGIEFYQLLSDMRETVRLSVIAGMFHQWDKRLRDWIVHEVRHWHSGENATKAIWKADFSQIVEFLVGVGFDANALPSFARLDAMRRVVNVFKHGDGPSLDELKTSYPEYLPDPLAGLGTSPDSGLPLKLLDHTHLKVSDAHLAQFSDAILDFWQAVPEHIFNGDVLSVPQWFEKAVSRDRESSKQEKKAQ